MDLASVIAHLRDFAPSLGGRITGAATPEGLPALVTLERPCAVVVPLADEVQPPRSQNVVRQILSEHFAVVVMVPSAGDAQGQGAVQTMLALRAELWKALLGWRPTLAHNGVAYERGGFKSLADGLLLYQFEFGASMEIGPEDGWEEGMLARLPELKTLHGRIDIVEPAADRNLRYPGPDGRIEHEVQLSFTQT